MGEGKRRVRLIQRGAGAARSITFALVGADNVYAWTREQMGEPSHEMLFGWMHRNQLTLDDAAQALGLSRRMISYYRSGRKPIPQYVWLACIGWERLHEKKAA